MIYHCYGGAHSSVTTSGIYLGLLPRDRVPSTGEILTVPHYDGNESITHGHFRFMGRDNDDRAVFALGKGSLGPRVNHLLNIIAGIYGCAGNIFSVDTTAPVNLLMVFGGYVSRVLKVVCLGRPFVVLGTKLAYFSFVRLASESEERLQQNCRQGEMLHLAMPRHAVFYLCPEGFSYPLLTAGFRLHPEASDEQLLCWARQHSFTGTVGSVLFLGTTDDCQVYLVGAGRYPVIVGRIIRELRSFLGVTQSACLVVNPGVQPSPAWLLAAIGCRRFGPGRLFRLWEERLFKKMIAACRKESGEVMQRIEEGILD